MTSTPQPPPAVPRVLSYAPMRVRIRRINLWLVTLDVRLEQLCNDRLSSGIGVRATKRAGHLGPPRLQRGPRGCEWSA